MWLIRRKAIKFLLNTHSIFLPVDAVSAMSSVSDTPVWHIYVIYIYANNTGVSVSESGRSLTENQRR